MDERKELEKMYENITSIPSNKNLYCQFESGFNFSCELEENLDNEQIFQLKSIFAYSLKRKSVFLIELIGKNIVTGMYMQNGVSYTINKIGLKKMHKMDFETGEKIKQKGFKYIEFNQLLFDVVGGEI
jgi:hypothetical protein